MSFPLVLLFAQISSAEDHGLEAIHEAAAPGRYRLSGATELRPAEISDDGVHTYIRWMGDQDLPAVFTLNRQGEEEMLDGYMREGVYTIDRINARLVFRIDRRTARADRIVKRK